MKVASRGTGVQVIARAAELLRVVADAKGLSLSDLAGALGLARSTVHRIIVALEKEGLVMSDGPGGYRLGPGFIALSGACQNSAIYDLHPYLERLSKDANETVDLSIRAGHVMTFVDQVIAPHRLRAVSHIGASFPVHCGANGKAALAALSPEEVRALLPKKLATFTPSTCTRRELLEKDLIQVRRTGVAFDREEHTAGICALGASVQLLTGDTVAISIPLPAERFYGREGQLTEILSKHCEEIRRATGSGLDSAVRRGEMRLGVAKSPIRSPAVRRSQHGRRTAVRVPR